MLHPVHVATPLTGVLNRPGAAHVSVAPVRFNRTIGVALLVTVLPAASSTVTIGWVPHVEPDTPPPTGACVNTNWVAAPKSARTMLPLFPVTVPFVAWRV